jgi:hypothetical protein
VLGQEIIMLLARNGKGHENDQAQATANGIVRCLVFEL